MCRPAHAIYLAARSWTGNLPDRPNLCLSMPRLENPLRPGCADWQRQCRLKNWAICEATLLSSGVCLKVSGRKKRAAMRRKAESEESAQASAVATVAKHALTEGNRRNR